MKLEFGVRNKYTAFDINNIEMMAIGLDSLCKKVGTKFQSLASDLLSLALTSYLLREPLEL